jgi:hypothetical protein
MPNQGYEDLDSYCVAFATTYWGYDGFGRGIIADTVEDLFHVLS